jgi:hypothetical protein
LRRSSQGRLLRFVGHRRDTQAGIDQRSQVGYTYVLTDKKRRG